MRFCREHWAALRAAIDERGLSHLIAANGAEAAARIMREVEEGASSPESYDPLMAAHWAIASNAMQTIERGGGSPLYLMSGGPEDPVDRPGGGYEGRTWPRCPLCYLNLAHEVSCTDPRCKLDRERGYDWMIERAADDQAKRVAEMPELAG